MADTLKVATTHRPDRFGTPPAAASFLLAGPPTPGGGHDFFSRILHSIGNNEIEPGGAQDLLPLFDVCPFQPDNDRDFHANVLCRLHDAGRHHVTSHNSAENVDQNCLNAGI